MLLRLIIEIALAGPGASTIARKKLPIELLQGAFWGNVSKMPPTTRRKKVAAHPIDWQRRQIYRPRQGLAVSSGSACTSASLEPSYVLRALGRSDELAHSSLRMTIGRFTTEEEIDYAIKTIRENVAKLRELSPLWEMHQEGIDLSTIQWAAH